MISDLTDKLRDPQYRTAFVSSQINIGIPFQIRALLKSRKWTQEKLAEETGMLQPRISALLKPGKVRPNIETLRRIAEAFDCALLVRFAPFSELVRWSDSFNPDNFVVPEFSLDQGFETDGRVAADRKTAKPPGLRALGTGSIELEQIRQAQMSALRSIMEFLRNNPKPRSLAETLRSSYSMLPPTTTVEYDEETAPKNTQLQIVINNTPKWRSSMKFNASIFIPVNTEGACSYGRAS